MGYYLGLDPSTKCTGYCIMDLNYDIIESGKINMPDTDDQGEKIFFQIERLEALMNNYEIEEILCEDQFSKLNIDTLKKLSRVVGAILYLAKKYNIPIDTTYPTSWRKIFHGSGKAKKEHTFEKVVALYELEGYKFKTHNDETDAIGICWALIDMVKERVNEEVIAA